MTWHSRPAVAIAAPMRARRVGSLQPNAHRRVPPVRSSPVGADDDRAGEPRQHTELLAGTDAQLVDIKGDAVERAARHPQIVVEFDLERRAEDDAAELFDAVLERRSRSAGAALLARVHGEGLVEELPRPVPVTRCARGSAVGGGTGSPPLLRPASSPSSPWSSRLIRSSRCRSRLDRVLSSARPAAARALRRRTSSESRIGNLQLLLRLLERPAGWLRPSAAPRRGHQ